MSKAKKIKRALRRPLEYSLAVAARGIIPFFPHRLIVGLSKLAGRMAVRLPAKYVRIGTENLDAVFGDEKSAAEKRAILAASFGGFCQTILDVIWVSGDPEKRIPALVSIEESDLKRRFYEDRPIVCVTAHLGSWEIMPQVVGLQGIELAAVAAPLKNGAIDRMFVERRVRTGHAVVPREGALRRLLSRLRNNGKVAFVLDQNLSLEKGGIMANLLGLPKSVSPAAATLAYRTGAEIMLVFCIPEDGGRYCIRVVESIVPPPYDKEADSAAVARDLTQRILDGLSAQIRRHPEHWLWAYKHWRRRDGETYPANYPNY